MRASARRRQINFAVKVLKIRKASKTQKGFLRQMMRLDPKAEMSLDVYHDSKKPTLYEFLSVEVGMIGPEASSLKNLLAQIKREAREKLIWHRLGKKP